MKILPIIAFSSLCSIASSHGATVLQFNEPFVGGISSNLSNAAGLTAQNGLFWGVLVDINGGGFATTTYDPITPVFNQTFSLTSMSLATDAVLVIANDLTGDQSLGGILADSSGMTGQAGGVGTISVSYTNGIAAGNSFALVWFDPSNSSAGLLTSGQFVLPTDNGAVLPVDDIFIGADPIRAANNIQFIPEPSTLLLSAFGFLALLRRRR